MNIIVIYAIELINKDIDYLYYIYIYVQIIMYKSATFNL